jgi:hypothetical protein
VPTKAQARKAGISEAQRLRAHRNALSRAAQSGTSARAGSLSLQRAMFTGPSRSPNEITTLTSALILTSWDDRS